jgi:hypothetical protein
MPGDVEEDLKTFSENKECLHEGSNQDPVGILKLYIVLTPIT